MFNTQTKFLTVLLMLLGGMAASARAMDLKVWTQPLTLQTFTMIDAESVRADAMTGNGDAATAAAAWLDQVRRKNPNLAYDLSARPVATIEITLLDPDED